MPRPKRLTNPQIARELKSRADWKLSRNALRRRYKLKTFPDAIRFVVAIADMAEAMDHHPDIDIRYRVVRIALSTHDVGGISRLDFDLADRIERHALENYPV